MRIAVSDYDGTMRRNSFVTPQDIAAIIKWKETGNIFGLATGRDLGMVLHETNRYRFPVDFIIAMNGAAIYDHDETLLQAIRIDDDVAAELLGHPAADASMHLCIMGDWPLRIFIRDANSWYHKLGVPFDEITYDQALATRGLMQISLGFIGAGESVEWARQLNERFAGRIIAHQNANTIDINPHGVDKAHGIRDLLALKKWEADELLVIGDGGNDAGMIKTYNGYTLPNASVRIKKAAKGIVDSLAELLGE